MTSLAVTNTFTAGTVIASTDVNTNYTDIVNYVNNRNSGAAQWEALDVSGNGEIDGTFTVTGTSAFTGAITMAGSLTNTLAAGNSLIVDSPTLIVDATNSMVGIGTTTPDRKLSVTRAATGATLTGTGFIVTDGVASTVDLRQSTAECQFQSNIAIGLAAGNSTTSDLAIDANGIITSTRQVSFSAHNNATQAIADATVTALIFNTEYYDAAASFASNTFTAPVAGRYLVKAHVTWDGMVGDKYSFLGVSKNAAADFTTAVATNMQYWYKTADQDNSQYITEIVNLAATDTLQVIALHNSGGSVNLLASTTGSYAGLNAFSVTKLN